MSISFNRLSPMIQSSTGSDPPIWLSGAMSLHKKVNPPSLTINDNAPAPNPPYGGIRLLLNYPNDPVITNTSKIQLDIMLQTLLDQALDVNIKVGDNPAYVVTVAGLQPVIMIELDGINLAPIDPANTQSKTLGLCILPGNDDSFTYIEVDGTIIP
jgi:hypothetical protein